MTAVRQTWQVTPALPARVHPPARLPRRSRSTQPIIWLLLFGALFKTVTQIPGFQGGSYIDFLTPGRRRHARRLLGGLERAWRSSTTSTAASWTACSSRRCGAAR